MLSRLPVLDENQSVVKKGRMDRQPDSDFLSNLPLCIIHNILMLVPIRDTVRTSILSRYWRYIWTSLPELVFDRNFMRRDDESGSESDFIARVLFLHKGPIQKFEISCPLLSTKPYIYEWVCFLSMNSISELVLVMHCSNGDWSQLHSSIYSCNKLTRLELHMCKVSPPPSTFKGFLFLRCLVLEWVSISTHVIESLVASSPLLETFILTHDEESELIIRALNLRCMHLDGRFTNLSVYAPLLVQISVQLSYYAALYQEPRSSADNFIKCIQNCTNLENLRGGGYFTKFLSTSITACGRSLLLHRLKVIELNNVNSEDGDEMLVVAHLLFGSPNLQQLKIRFGRGYGEFVPGNVCFRDLNAPNFTLEKLKAVEINNGTGRFAEDEFMKLLLQSSPVLESMRVIRELVSITQYSNSDWSQLHSSIYSCNKLTRLELYMCKLGPPPSTFKGFLFLRRLVLERVSIFTHVIESLVAGSPLLETFILSDAEQPELSVYAPNLKCMHLDGTFTKLSVYAPLLVQISVQLCYYNPLYSSAYNFIKYIENCTNLENLRGGRYFTKFLSTGIIVCRDSLLLRRLKVIELNDVDSEDENEMLVVARLVCGSPNLHQLNIRFGSRYFASVPGNVWLWELSAHNIRLEKLKAVELNNVTGIFPENQFMEFLLRSSPVLETMRVYTRMLTTYEIHNLRYAVSGYIWASPNVKVTLL